ncbi:glycosyltransferase [Candidatus Pacearchaeota archaeon]|nr:glycosyltransferase [Candidatus Pacearchaeota archaeon]
MIFITIGNHNQEFTRLIKRIDGIAKELKDKVVIQKGLTKYKPKNCESFDFAPEIDSYYEKARLVISHGGSSPWEFLYKYKKPLIIVPRQYKFDEHINDHQVEFSKNLEKKTGVKVILDVKELTPELLNDYEKVVGIDGENLKGLQEYLKNYLRTLNLK